jgi:3-oxoacyl-[acyl-carrier-protein] synthase I
MRRVWVVADAIISPLGNTTEENYRCVRDGKSGVGEHWIDGDVFHLSKIKDIPASEGLTSFERLCSKVLEQIIEKSGPLPGRTLLLLSTTKGNIELLDTGLHQERIPLHHTARWLASTFGYSDARVVSTACISGVLALITAKRFIQAGLYDHVAVVGADVISRFVVSGFNSLMALAQGICRPFDVNRTGINLGEAAAAVLLSGVPAENGNTQIEITGAGVSNDANHISGPSRTGEELASAVRRALSTACIEPRNVDFVSAHGTATLYNDEMEAKAFSLAGLEGVPVNSLKGYFGHTLGAAGVLESIISIHGMLKDELIGTKGYAQCGVSRPLKINAQTVKGKQHRILKTASGFGGCNAAIVFERIN